MVSEKPPRRSKANKEPVTIDLTAEETAAVAEPVRANDTDEAMTPAEKQALAADAADVPKADRSPADETAATEAETETVKSAQDTPHFDDPIPASPEVEAKAETNKDKPGLDEKPTWGEKASPPPPPFEPTPTSAKRGIPATSTLVASGIFGGIVALLLAGSMQYAGFLPGGGSSASTDTDVTAQLASLRQEIATLASRPADQSGDIEGRVAALESSTATTSAPDEALTQRLAALEGELSDIRSATQSNSGRLEQAEAQIADRGPEQMAARAVAAAALKSAIDRGGAFEAELETYKTLAADDPSIAQLQPLATRGIMSRVELQRQASDVANAMIDAVTQPDPDLSISERLLASAMSVVKVRKVGDVEGETPDAYIARFESKLRSGDLTGAAGEWAALPEAAKTASQDFKQELDARIEVENLISGTLTRAITGTKG